LLSGFSIKEEKTFLVNRREGVVEIPKYKAVKIFHDEDKGFYSINVLMLSRCKNGNKKNSFNWYNRIYREGIIA